MKSKVKQMLSVILTVCMLATVVPLNAYAADADFGDSDTTDVTVESDEVDGTDETEDVDISEEEPTEEPDISVDEEESQDENVEDAENVDDADVFSAGDDEDAFSDGAVDTQSFNYVSSVQSVSLPDEYMKIFHLDAGRKYFSVDQIEAIIDTLSSNGYNYMELAVGNDALRFLLDDMSVTVDGTTYSSEQVKAGIQAGNKAYHDAGSANELSQSEMDTIISYAKEKGISIIPLLNSPGHMDAIIDCMESKKIGMSNVAYNGSARTINVANEAAVNFTTALIQKYAKYFGESGCKVFNMGADEYANDVSNGFASLISNKKYGYFVKYVNSIAAVIKNAGMAPMAFNDGIYYSSNESGGTFDKDIAISYWTAGWGSGQSRYTPASASFLAGKGHKIINTNDAWYYVLGRAAGDSSGYNISTATNGVTNTKYNDVPGDNNPTPAGSMICVWCDSPSAKYSSGEQNNINTLITTFASNNQEIFGAATPTPTTPAETTPTPPSNDIITEPNTQISLATGEDTKVKINGVNYTGKEFTTEDPSIATVKVTNGVDAKDASIEYTEADVTYDTLIYGNYNSWRRCGSYYYLADDGNYYPLYAKRSSNRSWGTTYYSYTWGCLDSTGKYRTIKTESDIRYPNYYSPSITVYTQSTTEATEAFTEFTFTGVSAGTTYVQIGEVTYTINVLDKAPSNAMTATSIDLEYWITNYEVYDDSNEGSGNQSQTVSSTNANSDEGIAIADIAPNPAYSFFDGTVKVYYWQAMRLDSDNQQTNASGVDQTASGTTITHIRYTNAWQYETADGTWNYFDKDDQLVAYYLQKTQVTKEIDTYAKDWGYGTDGTTPNTSNSKGQVALTVAVVYPDGTISPIEGSMYANSTTIFNYWSGRDIGIVAPQNNSDYTIRKITVTDGTRTENTSDNVWYSNDTITWNKKQVSDESTSEWYDETTVWDEVANAGTTPMVNGKTSKITWSAKNTAKLVLIYLNPIERKSNLHVRYVDDSDNTKEILNFQIAMKYSDGETLPSFITALKQMSDVKTGTITLDDDAYVTNSSNVNQTFNKDLVTVTNQRPGEVDSKYLSGLYKYVSADISEDGKTLTLHYNLDSSRIETGYVIDFGEPITVPLSDIVKNPEDATGVEVPDEVANTYVVNADKSITFKLDKVLNGSKLIKVIVKYGESSSVTKRIALMPATTVYYEASFVKDGSGATSMDITTDQETQPTIQEAAKPGEAANGNKANYGYDKTYARTAVNDNEINLKNGSKTISFRGTGIDIYANTSPSTGTMMIMVKEGESYKKIVAVDTKMENGTSTGNQEVDGKNVPVATLNLGSDVADYTAELSCVKSGSAGKKDVYLDGFRVYNTLSDDGGAYAKDNEANPSYYELRDQVIAAVAGKNTVDGGRYADQIAENTMSQVYASGNVNGAVIIDPESSITSTQLKDLVENGPKNELYLQPKQTVVFSLNQVAQIGLKGVNGEASYTVKNATISGTGTVSTTDMFYRISSGEKIEITNTSEKNILSITKIKAFNVTNATSLFAPLTEESLTAALVSLGYEKAPDPTATPTVKPTQKPTQQIKLATPKLGKVVSAGYNVLKLNWSKVKGADGYRVYVKVNGQWKSLGDVKGTTYVHKHLETGKSYTFTVKAYKKTKSGIVWSSNDKKGVTGKVTLSAPSLRKAKRISAKKATLSWKKVDGANGYVVYRKTNNGRWQIIKKITKGSTTSFTDTKLSKGKKYTYTVRAYRTVGKKNVYSGYNAKGLTVK